MNNPSNITIHKKNFGTQRRLAHPFGWARGFPPKVVRPHLNAGETLSRISTHPAYWSGRNPTDSRSQLSGHPLAVGASAQSRLYRSLPDT